MKTKPRIAKCYLCKEIVDRAPCHTKDKLNFCNRECYLKATREMKEITANWKGGNVKFNCKVCGKECEKKRYSRGKPQYCSLKCVGAENGERQSGKNHWNWKGGNDLRYLKKIAPRPRPDKCEICGDKGKKRNGIVLDHNHKTKKFRGWLCSNCNTAIGLVQENTNILKSIISYLNENSL